MLAVENLQYACCAEFLLSTAVEYWKDFSVKDDQIHLVLLDFNLNHSDSEPLSTIIFAGSNGFDVASTLELAESDRSAPLKNFCYKPLIAMITSYADEMDHEMPRNVDGSVNGCDVLLPKPMSANWARVLVEACIV